MARRLAAPLLGLVVAIALFLNSRDLDRVAPGDQLGPGFWPRLVLAGLALACLARVVGDWRRHRGRAPSKALPGDIPGAAAEAPPGISWGHLLAAMALIVLYVLATPTVGFPLATAGFIVLFMRLCGAKSALAITANAVLGTVGLLYLFVEVVYLPLPKGAGPFEAATLALYRALRLF